MATKDLTEIINQTNQEAIELFEQKKYPEMIKKIEDILDQGITDYILYNTLGMAYLNINDPSNAASCFEKAIKERSLLGMDYLDLVPFYDTIDELEESAQRQRKEFGLMHANLAYAYTELGKIDEAIAMYKQAVGYGYINERLFFQAIDLCEKHACFEDSWEFQEMQEELVRP